MSHNQKLKAMLDTVKGIAENAQKEEDFSRAFSLLKEFTASGAKIEYDTSVLWKIFFVFCAVAGGFSALFFFLPGFQYALDGNIVFGFAPIALGLLIPLILALTKGGEIDTISDLMFEKDVLWDNKLTPRVIADKSALYHTLHGAFGDFRGRGDEDRYIQEMTHGIYEGEELKTEYDYYVFHYVEVYWVPVTHVDSKGNTYVTMERRTSTHHRYGLLLDFDFAKGIALVSGGGKYDYPIKWETASEDFNGAFSVYAKDELTASRFLGPTVVLACIEIAKHFSGLNIEVTNEGKMNIAFDDSNLLSLRRKYSIVEPEVFEEEISSMLGLQKLIGLLQFVEVLKKYNDSNF